MRKLLLFCALVAAAPSTNADLFMRVVDTGAGQCCVIRTHSDKYIVYDLGHWNGEGYRAIEGVKGVVPIDEPIALLVISHSDSDHLGAGSQLFKDYKVEKVVRSGFERDTATWQKFNSAIQDESGCTDVNLEHDELPDSLTFDDTKITFIAGWHEPPSEWGLSGGEFRNAGSICIRVEYAGKSILLCGDAVGRHLGESSDSCIATEKFMCDHADDRPIESDIIVAPHHGADNGSSTRFVQHVDPKWVIFSSGHAHEHPTYSAAKRYMDNGVDRDNILRTDFGDHEPGPYEWRHGRVDGNSDPPGDDDIDVRIKPTGFVRVKYRHNNSLSFSDPAAAPWNQDVPRDVLEQERIPLEILLRQEYGDDFVSEHERSPLGTTRTEHSSLSDDQLQPRVSPQPVCVCPRPCQIPPQRIYCQPRRHMRFRRNRCR